MKCPNCGKSLWLVQAFCPFCKVPIPPRPGLLRRVARRLRGPKCHIDSDEKQWIEERFLWLQGQFGWQPLQRAPLEFGSPTLPSTWTPSYEAGADLLGRLCKFMLVDPSRIQLQYYAELEPPLPIPVNYERQHSGPAGLFIDEEGQDRLTIALDAGGIDRPRDLATTICHELAHVHLLADKRISRNAEDSEPLTDLLTVYFGCGILTANAAFQFEQWQSGNTAGWSARRQGYLSQEALGYALACYAWCRGERQPVWSRHLQESMAYYFDDALHYLSSAQDTSLPFACGDLQKNSSRQPS
ncbi:MAG: hypothetical protein JNK85_02650 [Verrucomicrobiales bacterium]|nr:hypothetical protein [Verrucomicrobiales bacterium]